MTINDKIKQILIDKNITPSYFADEIGVQRSSISHILSGRNRPSFDLIQKIIKRFPELGYEWIMEEDSPSVVQPPGYGNGRVSPRISGERFQSVPPPIRTNQLTGARTQQGETKAQPTNSPLPDTANFSSATINMATRKAERIIVFYSDGSFQEYVPSN